MSYALLGSYRCPLRGPVCNGAACEFSGFLCCPSGHSTSIPLNSGYFPEIQVVAANDRS